MFSQESGEGTELGSPLTGPQLAVGTITSPGITGYQLSCGNQCFTVFVPCFQTSVEHDESGEDRVGGRKPPLSSSPPVRMLLAPALLLLGGSLASAELGKETQLFHKKSY